MKMKQLCRLFFSVIVLILLSFSVQGQKVTNIDLKNMPSKSKNFIKKNFPGQVMEKAFISRVTMHPTYNVVMRNRTEIVFDEKGVWKEIDGHGNGLPYTMLPAKAQKYIEREHLNTGFKRITKEADKYIIVVSNGSELRFDNKGKHINIGGNHNSLER